MITDGHTLSEKELLSTFEWFHKHPELSFEEIETTKRIREILTQANIEILDLPLETGLVAQITGGQPGPVIALRCDIDALPIQEESGLPYESANAGKMHACGHDFHTTAILGTTLLLKQRESELKGTVRILFQPGEESSLGALKITETTALNDVQAIFGIHTAANIPVGTVAISEGSVTAAVDTFRIHITGKGVHAAYPQKGIDPIVIAAQLISAAQTIVSRNLDPFHAGLVSITHVSSGNTWNVIPTEAFMEGTVRTMDKDDRRLIPKRLEELAVNIAAAYNAKAEFNWIPGPPATDNDGEWAKFSAQVAEEAGLQVIASTPGLGGEDFAFYQESLRGVYIQIGTGESEQNHHPKFKVDPKALRPTVEYMAVLAEKALAQLGGAQPFEGYGSAV